LKRISVSLLSTLKILNVIFASYKAGVDPVFHRLYCFISDVDMTGTCSLADIPSGSKLFTSYIKGLYVCSKQFGGVSVMLDSSGNV
jgi:hypothetical protein